MIQLMKRFSFTLMVLFMGILLNAQQLPLGINYQAIARNSNGDELKSTNLNVRISVISGNANGNVEYAETHSVTTDPFGLFKLVIGQGSYYTGSALDFNQINWGSKSHFLKVEADFGQGFISMGTMQFLAVPYALYAASAGDVNGTTGIQSLTYDPQTHILSLEEGGTVDLSGLRNDDDPDPTNELQTLSLEGLVLSLENPSGFTSKVTLSDVVNDADADPENEIQNLRVTQDHKLVLSDDPDPVDLMPYLKDSLWLSDNELFISNGNSVDIDADPENEIQNLSVQNNDLSISDGNTVSIDADTLNEIQELSLDGYYLHLSKNGDSVNIKPDIIAFRALKTTKDEVISVGDSLTLEFENELLDVSNDYNELNSVFTVPAGGEGLYQFSVMYDVKPSLRIILNDEMVEILTKGNPGATGINSYSFIYYLNEGDQVRIALINNTGSSILSTTGSFYGYRVH